MVILRHSVCRLLLLLLLASWHAQGLQEWGARGLQHHIQLQNASDLNAEPPRMQLRVMTEHGLAGGRGAVCLDGSDAAFYFSPAKNPAYAQKWQIALEGGGWCISPQDCYNRTKNKLGSNQFWGETIGMQGIYSDNCTVNPDFCNFNRVLVPYCDGASFAGDQEEPLEVNGKKIYFRGRRIFDAVIDTLLTMGLARAKEVMFSGFSAGGLAALIHADRFHGRLRDLEASELQKFGVVPLSALFLGQANVYGDEVYPEQMQYVHQLQNTGGSLDETCAANFSEHERWRCMLGIEAYQFVDSPVFVINSNVDQWALSFIHFGKKHPDWAEENRGESHQMCCIDESYSCMRMVNLMPTTRVKASLSFANCGTTYMEGIRQYQHGFVEALSQSKAFGKLGNGAFIHSCSLHVEANHDEYFSVIEVQGHTMQHALSNWWLNKPSPIANFMDCDMRDEQPYNCNPTCPIA
eukprot:TRINITY_DN40272_c0_g1_i1.p1 TRINITY_DN40272_c0_g1~~TRINITY_DN40272_c0_g1_i1.p1  ORF type:complete len:464 (+),score=56.73 TRINITY_DN40272_c0_g1_i1:100-1491(+)